MPWITQGEVEKKMRDILAQETEEHFDTESGKIQAQEIRRGEMNEQRRVTYAAMLEAYHLGRAHQRENI